MRLKQGIVLILTIGFCILGCSKLTDPAEDKPASVKMVPHQSDTRFEESGIDAFHEKDAIFIEWEASTDKTVEYYYVYKASNPNHEFQRLSGPIDVSFQSLKDENVRIDQRYYYYVVSVNSDDVESNPSDTLSYRLLSKAYQLQPEGDIVNTTPTFTWKDDIQPQSYIIKVISSEGGEDFIWRYTLQDDSNEVNYGGESQQIKYNKDGRAGLLTLPSGGKYKWRVDKIGGENNCGSESQWIPITIQ